MATKPTTSDVFNLIRPLLCAVTSPLGESSGFLLTKNGTMVTVAHNVPLNDPVVQLDLAGAINPLFPEPIKSINPKNAIALDLYAFETGIEVGSALPILPEAVKLHEGMKVFFAGFPFGHEKITFHKGVISSLTTTQGVVEFTIDGTVVPGNSGGPVVALHENIPYLIGMITSEMADFSSEDLKTIAMMKALKELKETEERNNPPQNLNELRFDQHGVTTPITITKTDGSTEVIAVNDRSTTILALDLIQRNLSTGVGRAFDIRALKYLTSEAVLETDKSTYFFPTGKGKKVFSGNITKTIVKKEKGSEKTEVVEVLKYMEVRYGKGKGPRGIRLTMSDKSGSYVYKFTDNPHTKTPQYNNKGNELYDAAALQAATLNLAQSPTFTCMAYNHLFTAVRQ